MDTFLIDFWGMFEKVIPIIGFFVIMLLVRILKVHGKSWGLSSLLMIKQFPKFLIQRNALVKKIIFMLGMIIGGAVVFNYPESLENGWFNWFWVIPFVWAMEQKTDRDISIPIILVFMSGIAVGSFIWFLITN